jgi:predicted nucleic acid-binding Zn ribbon protein
MNLHDLPVVRDAAIRTHSKTQRDGFPRGEWLEARAGRRVVDRDQERDKETRVIWFSLLFLVVVAVLFFFFLIVNPPPYHDWGDHDRWYDLTLQTT